MDAPEIEGTAEMLGRLLAKMKNIVQITVTHVARLAVLAKAHWQTRILERNAFDANVDLGRRMAELGIGDAALRGRIARHQQSMRDLRTGGAKARRIAVELEAEQADLAKIELQRGTPPPGAETEYVDAVSARATLQAHQDKVALLVATVRLPSRLHQQANAAQVPNDKVYDFRRSVQEEGDDRCRSQNSRSDDLVPVTDAPFVIAESSLLSVEARHLASTRPIAWEHRLFFQVLTDEISAVPPPVPSLENPPQLPSDEFLSWVAGRIAHFRKLSEKLVELVNADHADAFGIPGEQGNVDKILSLARRITRYHRCMTLWVDEVGAAEAYDLLEYSEYETVKYELLLLAETAIRALERYGPDNLHAIGAALTNPPAPTPPNIITARLVFDAPDLTNVNRAINACVAIVNAGTALEHTHAGYIYVLTNSSMPGLLKIGRTKRDPRQRVEELSAGTGVPTKFVLAYDAFVDDCLRAEAFVHARLSNEGHRVAANREFFDVDLHRAIEIVLEAQSFVACPQAPEEMSPVNAQAPLEDLSAISKFLHDVNGAVPRAPQCVALANLSPDAIEPSECDEFDELLLALYARATDGATHAAAGWALRQWKRKLPTIEPTSRPMPDRRWFVNRQGMTLVEVPAGRFTLGARWRETQYKDEAPAHDVTLTRSFYLADCPVTIEQFERFVADQKYPATTKPRDWRFPAVIQEDAPDCPMRFVNWFDAVLYCNWLSSSESRRTCYRQTGDMWHCDFAADGYRLPTEAEWEYAARAGSTGDYFRGVDGAEITISELNEYAWFHRNANFRRSVRLKRPNAWGLFDMLGNVWEWCWDWHGSYRPEHASDPTGPSTGEARVIRGGSFNVDESKCRCGFRCSRAPAERSYGFRVLCST